MRITGRVEGNELVITLSPYGWRVVIDTGFTNEIFVTEERASQIGLSAAQTKQFNLADGTPHVLAIGFAEIDWFGQDRVTEFCWLPGSVGAGILIGIGLLKSHLLNLL